MSKDTYTYYFRAAIFLVRSCLRRSRLRSALAGFFLLRSSRPIFKSQNERSNVQADPTARRAQEGLTQRTLTDLMASDPNTITSTLSRMETAALIERLPHELDRRAHRVKMLPAGRRIFLKGRKIAMELQDLVLAVLPLERRQQFLDDLEIIGRSCAEVLEKPAASCAGGRKPETPPKSR